MNYKQQAALEAQKLIEKGQIVGLGAGNTIMYLLEALIQQPELVQTLTFTSSSAPIKEKLITYNLNIKPASELSSIDIYFDGCDQIDLQLNALKSGAGIHTTEKIFAAMAKQFIILGDMDKLTTTLNTKFPLTIEVIPDALTSIQEQLTKQFEISSLIHRPATTSSGNLLIDVTFTILPDLNILNNIKMLPGIVDHSLFYKIATGAIICGEEGTKFLK